MPLHLNNIAACSHHFATQNRADTVMVLEAFRLGLLIDFSGMTATHLKSYRRLRLAGCLTSTWDHDRRRPRIQLSSLAGISQADILNAGWSVVRSFATEGVIRPPVGKVPFEHVTIGLVVGRGRPPLNYEPFFFHHPDLHPLRAVFLLARTIEEVADQLTAQLPQTIH